MAFISCLLVVLVCSSYAFAQTEQVRLKLKDGSYMDVDEASETPQGVWYRKGSLSHLLPKEKVKKIERTTTAPDTCSRRQFSQPTTTITSKPLRS